MRAVTRTFLLIVVASIVLATSATALSQDIQVWHAYRGAEQSALDTLAEQWNQENPTRRVRLLSVPYDAFANKLTSAIPRGHGPDVFIAAHERIGDWSNAGLLLEWSSDEAPFEDYHPTTVEALTYESKRFGVPLAYKSLVLFYNPSFVETPPATTDDLIRIATEYASGGDDRYGLAYEATNFYMHVPWLFGFGGAIFDGDTIRLNRPENAESFQFAYDLVHEQKVVPDEATGALVAQLFNQEKAPFAISGPWFVGELRDDLDFALAPLPKVSKTGLDASPFLTVEAAFVSATSPRPDDARTFARFLAEHPQAVHRAIHGHQPIATLSAYDDEALKKIETLKVFREQLDASVPMPNSPKMRSVWEPAATALRQVMRGAVTPELALKQADRRVEIFTRPAPEAADPTPTIIFFTLVSLVLAFLIWRSQRGTNLLQRARQSGVAYVYVAPAVLAMLVLVVTPFVVGSAVSLFAHRGGEFTFVGLGNFANILLGTDFGFTDPLSFYFTLLVTVLWTVLNVFLHVSIGLGLALILRNGWVRLRGFWRVLLIIPWAVPNYITALIWRGMFHRQFGAINGVLEWFGVEPVSWFSQFSTAFAANLATNVWLGFPFMMVVTLGALQAIPRDLEEAAEVDGASRWQTFRHVTLPLLRPALVPAVVLGTVWTFNSFNIIYLVSQGEPDGATEILISEAYKWAFTRQEQYGYAAAYAVLIFFVLLFYSLFTGQLETDD